MTDLTPIARWLETRRERLAMGRTEFAKHLGVDQSLYGRWIDEGIIPGSANLARIASALGVQHVTLMIIAGHVVTDQPDAARLVDRTDDFEFLVYPLLVEVAAGEAIDTEYVIAYRPAWLKRFPRHLTPARVVGTCLLPDVQPGDVAFIDPDASWGPQSVIAVRSDGGVQLKRFVRHEPGPAHRPGRLVLTSNEGEFALSDDDARIVGVMLWAQRTITL